MGQPKALVRDPDGTSWLNRAVDTLSAGGCNPVVVVLGAEAERAVDILNERQDADLPVRWVVATDWAEGMSASLRRGLEAATDTLATTVVVTLVDLTDVGPDVVQRVVEAVGDDPEQPRAGRLPRSPPDTPSSSAASTGPAWRRGRSATGARATTSRRTTCFSSSAATSPAAWTVTYPPLFPSGPLGVMIGECSPLWIPPPTWPRVSDAPATSSTRRWPPSGTSRSRSAGRCSSRASPGPARPRSPRRSPRRWTCR